MFIYRDEYYNADESDQQGLAEVHLAKHRNGPTGHGQALVPASASRSSRTWRPSRQEEDADGARQVIWLGADATDVRRRRARRAEDATAATAAGDRRRGDAAARGRRRLHRPAGAATASASGASPGCAWSSRAAARQPPRPAADWHTPAVPATVIVGAQWGDEGKGKIVDLLAQRLRSRLPLQRRAERRAHDRRRRRDVTSSATCRPGSSAGKECVIGAGCVVDPEVLRRGARRARARAGISTERRAPLRQRAPDHAVAPGDRPGERAAARQAPDRHDASAASARPTPTRRARLGIRVQDLLDPKILRQKIEVALAEKNVWLERVYGVEPLELEELAARYEGYAQRLRPYVADTSLLVDRALRDGQARAVRGRAGDAARPRPRHVSVRHLVEPDRRRRPRPGIGIGPTRIDAVDRRREGVRDARRRRAVPDRDRGARPGARARARRRVRHGDRPRAPLRLARPRRAALRGRG